MLPSITLPSEGTRAAGLEPATCGLEVRCSIQLSHARFNHRSFLPLPRRVVLAGALPFFFLDERGRPTFIPRNASLARIPLIDIMIPYQVVSLRPAASTRP